MDFFDNFVIPQSAEHINLLHYILMLIFFLFIPFISIVLGGTALSLFYRAKGLKEKNNLYLKFSNDLIETLTINKSIGIILGLAPLLTAAIIYTQLLQTAGTSVTLYLLISFVLTCIGLILIYTYRYSLSFNQLFDAISGSVDLSKGEISDQLIKFSRGSHLLSTKSGRYGLGILIIALWIFTAAVTTASYTIQWHESNLLKLIFSWNVFSRFLTFLSVSLAFTGASVLFIFFWWEGGKNLDDLYSEFVRNAGIRITFLGSLLVPLFMFINILSLPGSALSAGVFGYSAVALILIFFAYNLLYAMFKYANAKFSGQLFFIMLFSMLALIVKDQLAMGNATKLQTEILDRNYHALIAKTENVKSAPEVVSGEKVYQTICIACHRFDVKLVGPAYDNVLPKYEGKVDQLIAFIRNPVKVNPAFPPMPNPGLRPNQAKAVADYEIIEHMKHMFEKRTSEAGNDGEKIFNTICFACHSFDKDMVGPSFGKVLSKYDGKENDLIAFLSNPKKINPDFPQMPNPGLAPGQLKAITTYVLDEYRKKRPI
ncbi:MAG TPA: c-type cytochrome [Ignavibacteriaceae bacterium]|nr:c-type cytochrome [Ignavibacteriaceae bacterium]